MSEGLEPGYGDCQDEAGDGYGVIGGEWLETAVIRFSRGCHDGMFVCISLARLPAVL